MANLIKIKRSEGTGTPSSLSGGELAYSEASGVLYIGLHDGTVIAIGGYTQMQKLLGIEDGAQVNTVDTVNTKTGTVVLDKDDIGLGNVDNVQQIPMSYKGANNGVAELDSTGKVPTSQLPSYVDDIIEVANFAALPGTGESDKIYITLDDNKLYRWTGSVYAVISESLALGETSATAYRGDRGKTAYDHSQVAHAPSDAEQNVKADWTGSGDAEILNKPTDLTDLSLHDVTELADVTNAGSGAIITVTERNKLNAIAAGAEVNVQSDWDATSGDALILNKPSIPANQTFLHADLTDTATDGHPATVITEDSSHRFATDAEKTSWNAKLGPNSTIDGGTF